jgi:GntR family transcriptional regulator, rspAB operon transcriptional repressor
MPHSSSAARKESATFAVERNPRETKSDRIYAVLKQGIVSGALAPNTPIDKAAWGTSFGVSRLSETTAVNRLAFERLVVIEPQRGTFVAKIRLADVKQWMLVRRAIEVELVGTSARELGNDGIKRLERNLAYQRAALDSGDIQGFHDLDTLFHRRIVDGLGLARVGDILEPVRTHLDRVRRTLLPERGRIEATFVEH